MAQPPDLSALHTVGRAQSYNVHSAGQLSTLSSSPRTEDSVIPSSTNLELNNANSFRSDFSPTIYNKFHYSPSNVSTNNSFSSNNRYSATGDNDSVYHEPSSNSSNGITVKSDIPRMDTIEAPEVQSHDKPPPRNMNSATIHIDSEVEATPTNISAENPASAETITLQVYDNLALEPEQSDSTDTTDSGLQSPNSDNQSVVSDNLLLDKKLLSASRLSSVHYSTRF